VVSKGGLRSRESAAATAKETVVLPTGSTVFALEIQGFWVRHPEGWSMLHSDPAKGVEPKIFLVEKKDAFYIREAPPLRLREMRQLWRGLLLLLRLFLPRLGAHHRKR